MLRSSPTDLFSTAEKTISIGADDGIRTRDPHLGKVMDLVRRLGSSPLSGLSSAGCSVQSAESAPLRWPTLNALNLYQLECRCGVATP